MKRLRVTVCCGPECGIRTADIEGALAAELAKDPAKALVSIDTWSCFGRCRSGPNMIIYSTPVQTPKDEQGGKVGQGPSTMYNQLTPRKAACILREHLESLEHPDSVEP